MVIDDTEIDRFIAKTMIEKSNFAEQILLMPSGNNALEYLDSTSRTMPEDLPEIILLDIYMPEMNGFEFLDKFKDLPEVIKDNCMIIMVSSSLDSDDIERSKRNTYAHGFIPKPLMVDKIVKLKPQIMTKYKEVCFSHSPEKANHTDAAKGDLA